MQFSDLGLRAELMRSLAEQGYDTPTPIQQKAIPLVLAGHDLMAAAQTGTGKTAGFTLPILQMLAARDESQAAARKKSRVLILTPTRELCAQVFESVKTYGKHLPISSISVFGGVGMGPQAKALRNGVDIIIATPGRLLDHINEKNADLSQIEIVVLDEADRMLDMGFLPDVKKLFRALPHKRQTLMYSATFSDDIRELASSLLHQPKQVEVAARNATVDTVKQSVIHVDRNKKRELLEKMIEDKGWHQVLVFTRTKHGANALAERLDKSGIHAAAIHGNKSQNARTKALADFKSLKLHVLVATDIAARGIDIDQLPYVVNFELPNIPEDYVHRIGRTGRAGATGEAISLVCVDEHKLLRDIERLIKRPIEKRFEPGFEPDPNVRPQPIENGRRAEPSRGGPRSGAPARSSAGRPGQPSQARRSSTGAGAPRSSAGRSTSGKPRSEGQRSSAGARQR